MRMSEAFPSNYIRAIDLKGRDVTVTISRVVMEDIGGDTKPVLYFQGTSKGMVLNKTNANNIASMYGDESDAWSGRQITVFPSQTDFQGKSVPCIRVRINGAAPSPAPVDHVNPENNLPPVGHPFDDDIPF